MVRTRSLRTQSARHRVDHGTICGRSCANSGHYKPLCAYVDRIFVDPNSSGRRPENFGARADANYGRSSDLHRSRAVRWPPRGRRRSVGRGGHRPAIEPRKPIPGCRRRFERGRQHVSDAPSQGPNDPAWSKNLACACGVAHHGAEAKRPWRAIGPQSFEMARREFNEWQMLPLQPAQPQTPMQQQQ